MAEKKHREDIVRYGKLLYERGFIAATDGNLSVRLDEGHMLITPTCVCKGMIESEDLVITDLDGQKLEGERNVSSEIAMHVLIYRMRPDVRGIVHAHPPTATGFAAAGLALDEPLISEVVLTIGAVPLAKYACPGTSALSDSLRPFVADHNAILMANHGVVTYGDDLDQAFMNMETVEHFAKIALVARTAGEPRPIAPEEVRKLEAIREQLQAARRAERNNVREMEEFRVASNQ
ncbi:MAG: class II aldolase/adducin family protein [Terriglobales bacterium]